MDSLKLVLSSLVVALLLVAMASAQTTRVHRHRDPNLPSSSAISAPGVGPKGGVDAVSQAGESALLSKDGDIAQGKNDWETAQKEYSKALDLWPDNPVALYGSAKCAETDGDTAAAIGYYRTAIYSHDTKVYGTVPGDGYRTNDVGRMMEFVLLLSQSHQDAEAQKVYKRASHVLNYQDSQFHGGKPFLKVLLPEFGPGPGQTVYTPQRLQAMAHVTLSLLSAGFDGKVAIPEIQKALQLYPDSAVVYYYLGERLFAKSDKGAKAAYQKAAQLDGAQVGAAVHDALKNIR